MHTWIFRFRSFSATRWKRLKGLRISQIKIHIFSSLLCAGPWSKVSRSGLQNNLYWNTGSVGRPQLIYIFCSRSVGHCSHWTIFHIETSYGKSGTVFVTQAFKIGNGLSIESFFDCTSKGMATKGINFRFSPFFSPLACLVAALDPLACLAAALGPLACLAAAL